MIKLKRTLLSVAAALFLACTFLSVRCFAFDYSKITGSTATGANISGYSTAIEVNVKDFGADSSGKKDSYQAIQDALYYAVDNASDTVQLKVVIPEGTYLIKRPLKIYSNTWLYMKGATIVRGYSKGFMFKNALQNPSGGYNGERNIIIEGGCFDGNTDSNSTAFSNVRLGHINNLWIKDVEFRDNYNGHLLEIGGAKNVTIENCSFHEYYGEKQKEAIQLDTMNNSNVFVHFAPFDDTNCENVVIRNNKFYDLMRGFGSHSATIGVYYKNILISGNTFDNITDCAMILQNYKNCLIENNTITNTGSGIDFKNMTEFEYVGYNPPVAGYDGIYDRLNNNANTIIRKNTIKTRVTSYVPQPFAIQLYGKKLQASIYPDFDYKVEGVKISDNDITTVGTAILLNDTNGIQISSNNISYDGSGYHFDADLVVLRGSSDCSVIKNKINGGPQSAIYTGTSTNITVKENTCSSPGASGVFVSLSSNKIKVTSNKITSPSGNGIKVTKDASADLESNVIENSAARGIIFTSGSGSAKKNTITGSAKDGIMVEGEVEVTVSGNTVSGGEQWGLHAKDKGVAVVSGNNYSDNKSGSLTVSGGGNIAAAATEKLTADEVYQEHIQLSWTPVSEADSYVIERKLRDSEEDFYQIAEVYSASYVDLGLTMKTRYEYRVKGIIDANGTKCSGKNSAVLDVRTKASIETATADLTPVMRYSGREIVQNFSLTLDGDVLIPEIDYKTRYSNNTSVGTASVIVTGCGQFCGIKEFTFEISFSNGAYESVYAANSSPLRTGDSIVSESSSAQVKIFTESSFGKNVKCQNIQPPESGSAVQRSMLESKKKSGMLIRSRRVSGSAQGRTYGLWV